MTVGLECEFQGTSTVGGGLCFGEGERDWH